MVNDYFDHIFCIYLEKRKNDWFHEGMQEWVPGQYDRLVNLFKKHNINVEFIEGIDGELLDIPTDVKSPVDGLIISKGDIGCTRSHQKVAQIAKDKGYHEYLVFEADVMLADDFTEQFEKYYAQLPWAWDMVYLGGNHDKGFRYLKPDAKDEFLNWDNYVIKNPGTESGSSRIPEEIQNVVQIFGTFTTHAFAVRRYMYDEIINVLGAHEKVDISITSLHEKYECYCLRPHIAWQAQGFSDILGRMTDGYNHLIKGGYEYNGDDQKWLNPPPKE